MWGDWNKAVLKLQNSRASVGRLLASVNGEKQAVWVGWWRHEWRRWGCLAGEVGVVAWWICARVEILGCERGAPPPPASRHIGGVGMVDRWACLFNGEQFLKYEFAQNIFYCEV